MRAVRLVADDCANGDVLSLNTGSHQVQNLISQKFAELLIKECIQTIQNKSMGSGDEWEDGSRTAEGAIRERFGVEE